jgi:hypothetical protein
MVKYGDPVKSFTDIRPEKPFSITLFFHGSRKPCGKVTAIFSIMAYVWLIVILDWISPNVVEIWDAAKLLRASGEHEPIVPFLPLKYPFIR